MRALARQQQLLTATSMLHQCLLRPLPQSVKVPSVPQTSCSRTLSQVDDVSVAELCHECWQFCLLLLPAICFSFPLMVLLLLLCCS
jgi:hypothetical protein